MAILIGLWHRLILWVCLSPFLLKRVVRPDHRLGSNSQYRRDICQGLCQGLVGHLCLNGLIQRVGMRLICMARGLLVALFPPVLLSQEGKVGMGVGTPDVPQPSTSSSSLSSTSAMFQVGMLFKFFDQWKSITSNRFVLNMVLGHHLQLRSHPPLFCDFQHFNVKAAAAHHPVIQKEVDELLAKGVIEPSSSGAGFHSCMFVVPKHTRGLPPILNLKHFNCFMHIPSLRCQLLNMYGSLSSRVILPFPLMYRMLLYMFPLLSIIIVSYILFGIMCLISGRFYLFGLPQPLGFLHPSQTFFVPLPSQSFPYCYLFG